MILLTMLVACALLSFTALSHFIAGAFSEEGALVSREALAAAARYFPQSARLQARLATVELAATTGDEQELAQAEAIATRAVSLSPWAANNWLLLASAKEVRGDLAAAEEALRQALALAPHDVRLHWQLANLMVRAGKPEPSFDEFRIALASDQSLLPTTLNLVWSVSGGDFKTLDSVTGNAPQARLALAQFMLSQGRVTEAASVFSRVDRSARLASPEAAAFLDHLIAADQIALARQLWVDLVTGGSADNSLVWNGGFESEIKPGLAQFDWNLGQSDYALISIDATAAHTGARSLRVNFTGRDTTRLDSEIKQWLLLRPGARYRLECFVKAENLVTSEGPRVAITSRTSSAPLVVSEPVAAGAYNWRRLSVDFVVPMSSPVLTLTLKRTPKFSYDEPTRGAIWFDDFSLTEL